MKLSFRPQVSSSSRSSSYSNSSTPDSAIANSYLAAARRQFTESSASDLYKNAKIDPKNVPDVKSVFSSLYPIYIPNNSNVHSIRSNQPCSHNPEFICSGDYPEKANVASNLQEASMLMGGLPVSFARLDINNLQATKSFRTLPSSYGANIIIVTKPLYNPSGGKLKSRKMRKSRKSRKSRKMKSIKSRKSRK